MGTPMGAPQFWGLAKDHVPVRTYPGWETHNRGRRGDGWGPVHGIGLHDFGPYRTVAGAVDLARRGRDLGTPDELPGPLYNVLVDRVGTAHLLGWGRSNHAGGGDPRVLDALITEEPLPRPRRLPAEQLVDMNARLYGICLLNRGGGTQDYPAAQLRTAAVLCAILVRHHRPNLWTAESVLGHRHWQYGKVDPATSVGDVRTMVEAYRRHLPDLRPKDPAPAPCGCTVKCGCVREVAGGGA